MTIYDIAKEAGVSASTVSRVLNNKPGIKAETREKVREILDKYHFEPDETARGLVLQASKTIGLLIADVRIAYYMEGIHIIISELAKLGYCCILLNTGISSSNRAEYIRILSQRKVEGAILIGSAYQCEEVQEAIAAYMSRTPVVIVNGFLDMPNVYGVLSDEREGAERCFDLFYERGYRHPAVITTAATASNEKKLAGCLESARCHGQAGQVPVYAGEDAVGYGYEVTARLLRERPETDAIFYASDVFAVAGLRRLREAGVAVPERIGVIGGDESFYATVAHPLVTTMDGRIEDLCLHACNTLVDVLQGRPAAHSVTFPTEINERETTRGNEG